MNKKKVIDVGKEFYHRLANIDELQGDGKYTSFEFRQKYLSFLDNKKKWVNSEEEIVLDFQNVKKIGCDFANNVFAYFRRYANPKQILNKINIINASNVQKRIIEYEVDNG